MKHLLYGLSKIFDFAGIIKSPARKRLDKSLRCECCGFYYNEKSGDWEHINEFGKCRLCDELDIELD